MATRRRRNIPVKLISARTLISLSPFLSAFQDLRFDGNQLVRVPTEVLAGPEALQNLQLQDNIIGERDREG